MKITYEIKNFKELKELSFLSKIGMCLFLLGFLGFFFSMIIDISISSLGPNFPLYSIGIGFLGFFITVLFDKNRKTKLTVRQKGPGN
jgi:preprotein translocase subunit Sss1